MYLKSKCVYIREFCSFGVFFFAPISLQTGSHHYRCRPPAVARREMATLFPRRNTGLSIGAAGRCSFFMRPSKTMRLGGVEPFHRGREAETMGAGRTPWRPRGCPGRHQRWIAEEPLLLSWLLPGLVLSRPGERAGCAGDGKRPQRLRHSGLPAGVWPKSAAGPGPGNGVGFLLKWKEGDPFRGRRAPPYPDPETVARGQGKSKAGYRRPELRRGPAVA